MIIVSTILHALFACFHLLPIGAAPIAKFLQKVEVDDQDTGFVGMCEINGNTISDAMSERATKIMPGECLAALRTFFTAFSHLDHLIPRVAFAHCVLLDRESESRDLPRRRSY